MHIRCHRNCCSRLKQGPYERDNYSLVTDKEKKVKAKPVREERQECSKRSSYKSLYLGKGSLQNLAVNSGFHLPLTVPLPPCAWKAAAAPARASLSVEQTPPWRAGPRGWWEPWAAAGHTAQLHRGALLGWAGLFQGTPWISILVRYWERNKSTFLTRKWEPELMSIQCQFGKEWMTTK